jgi:putative membrane protein
MFRYVLLCGLSVAAVGGAMAQTTSPSPGSAAPKTEAGAPVNENTKAFIRNAAASGKFEIESSQLAAKNASSGDVKSFAQRMIDDHTKANESLAVAARQAGTTAAEPKLSPKHQQVISDLKKASGPAFDRTYVDAQITAHEAAVSEFQTYAKQGDNAQIKQFATRTLPVLQKHLESATDLKQSLSGAATGPGSGIPTK